MTKFKIVEKIFSPPLKKNIDRIQKSDSMGIVISNTHPTVNIPGAFIEMMFAEGHTVPTEEEIRRVGKGKQYEVRIDADFANLVRLADQHLAEEHHGTKPHYAAVSMLRAIKAQGHKVTLTNELPAQNTRRWVWIKTEAVVPPSVPKYAGRKLLAGIERSTGTLAIRIAGTRQVQHTALGGIFAQCVHAEAWRIIRERKAAKKDRLAQRRAARKVA